MTGTHVEYIQTENQTVPAPKIYGDSTASQAEKQLPVRPVSIGAMVPVIAMLSNPFSTAIVTYPPNEQVVTGEPRNDASAISGGLADLANRLETVIFSHQAKVVEIEQNASGDPISVTLDVSVDGKNFVLKRPRRHFNFEVIPDMRIWIDGVVKRGVKQLSFRAVQPINLSEQQKGRLNRLIAALKPI